MKILILVSSLTSGGEQRVASLWATGFADRGHDVAMVLGCSRKLPHTYKVPDQTRIYYVQNILAHHLYKRWGIEYYYTKKLRKIIQTYHPNLIVSLYHPWTEWVEKVTKGEGIPVISTEHTTFERPQSAKMSSKVYHQKYELNKNHAAVTVLTKADKECLKGHLNNVTVLPNPLTYTPASVIPPKENVILAVGQLHSWHTKGLDLLIKAWGTIAKNYSEWKLQIAGRDKNNSHSYLQSIADEFQLGSQIEFLGFQSDMLPIYQRSSIFVLSSRYEGFGMALIEAMSQGCACIACDYKGRQSEIITSPQEGLICPIENITELAKSIESLIVDGNYRHILQQRGIERSKYYNMTNIMSIWDKIIHNVFFCSLT